MGGTVELESVAGRTTFRLSLPAATAAVGELAVTT
jgi:nitrogen-specific signal transduction histidine kinase